MTPDELRALAIRLGCSSLALSKQESLVVDILGCAVFAFCEGTWEELIQCAVLGAWPLLYCHGSDGWSRIVSEVRQVTVDDHLIRRHGKLRAEFNLEREVKKEHRQRRTFSPRHGIHSTQAYAQWYIWMAYLPSCGRD